MIGKVLPVSLWVMQVGFGIFDWLSGPPLSVDSWIAKPTILIALTLIGSPNGTRPCTPGCVVFSHSRQQATAAAQYRLGYLLRLVLYVQ